MTACAVQFSFSAILALGGHAVASDVQPGDHVAAISDGIARSDWPSFEAFQDGDARKLDKLADGCLIFHGAPPTLWIADVVKETAAAVWPLVSARRSESAVVRWSAKGLMANRRFSYR